VRDIDEVLHREITYEQYERAKAKSGYLTKEDREKVFYPSELYGYGVYGGDVIERDGKYYVRYSLGSTCD
jgi:hypothetical protein